VAEADGPFHIRWHQRPHAPAPGTELGPLADIPDGQGREYVFGEGKRAFSLFVVRRGGAAFGYLNVCPHFQLTLNSRPDMFMTRDGSRIKCSQHLALFRIEDGFCLDGACEGDRLEAIPLDLEDGLLTIAD